MKDKLKKEVQSRTVGYILTALGLVAGLAWNEAIKEVIDLLFPLSQNSVWAKFGYAFLITIIVVFASIYLMRFFGEEDDK